MQFINNNPGRAVVVNVGIDKVVTVLPGQLIDLPLQDGLAVGLTPVDDFRQTVPPRREPPKAPPIEPIKRDDDKLLAQVEARIDRGMERMFSLLGAIPSPADFQQIKDKLDGLIVQKMMVPATETAKWQTGTFIPLRDDRLGREIEADTSTIKVATTSSAADADAADDLASLLEEKS